MIFKKIILYESILNKDIEEKLKKKFILKRIDRLLNSSCHLSNVHALFVKLENKIDKKFLTRFNNLSYVISPTTGLTHIDQNYCRKKKIKIIHLKSNTNLVKKITATAEYNLSLILLAVRSPHKFFALTKQKKRNRYFFTSKQFFNYKIGLIGKGRIGKKLSEYLKNLNFKILSYDKKIHTKARLYKLLHLSDIISVNINSAKNNINFIDRDFLNQCKANVKIINSSRGEVINEKHLLKFLKKNKYAEAYLDCIKDEYNKTDEPFLIKNVNKFNNLFISPHVGGACLDAIEKTEEIVINEFLKNEKN